MKLPSHQVVHSDNLPALRRMPTESVHCVISSPPYWSLRDYNEPEQVGLEDHPEEYVERVTEIFSEVRRVLRADGTLWLNLGDAYAQGGRGKVGSRSTLHGARHCHNEASRAMKARGVTYRRAPRGFKPKDLLGLPWRVAFALQAEGWYLRSDVVWEKPNALPEPVRDRPTRAHEYLFLFSKSKRYFYDAEAVKERAVSLAGGFRNLRSVWSICSAPTDEEHFATFPEDLVRPCILAGTSERGCCAECGAQVVRQVERIRTLDGVPTKLEAFRNTSKGQPRGGNAGVGHGRIATVTRTIGWRQGCKCTGGGAPTRCSARPFLRLRDHGSRRDRPGAELRRHRAQRQVRRDEREVDRLGRAAAVDAPASGGGLR